MREMEMHMPIQIVRVGRKRKAGRRHPNGDLAHAKGENVGLIAVRHPDRQGIPESMRLHQAAGTPLGRLSLLGFINAQMLEAAKRYSRDVKRYLDIFGAPSPNAPSINMNAGDKEHRPPLKEPEIARRIKAYTDAFDAVYDAGHKAARAVARMAVYEERIPDGCSVDDLKRGLSALAHFYGLTGNRKSGYSRNRD
jgi:hypothetical protein